MDNVRQLRSLDLTGLGDASFRHRFWSKVDATGECWVWTRYCLDNGYGQFYIRKGEPRLAHIVSFALTKGTVGAGAYVCHRCDNPPCVRPDHLFVGSPADNTADMFKKGRQGSRHPGSERSNARLTEHDIVVIRAVSPRYGRTAELARQYGVSETTIRKILAGRKWRHVT